MPLLSGRGTAVPQVSRTGADTSGRSRNVQAGVVNLWGDAAEGHLCDGAESGRSAGGLGALPQYGVFAGGVLERVLARTGAAGPG